jgi:hypothetical protein
MNDPRQDIIETITNLFVGTDERDWAHVRRLVRFSPGEHVRAMGHRLLQIQLEIHRRELK